MSTPAPRRRPAPRRLRRGATAFAAAALLCLGAAAAAALAADAARAAEPDASSAPDAARAAEPDPAFDVRDRRRVAVEAAGDEAAREPTAAMRAARRALARSLGDQGVVDVDTLTGTPRVLARLDGTLTRRARGDEATIALRYVREHLPALGLTEGDLGSFGGLRRLPLPGGGEQLRWRQYDDGIPALDNGLRVTITRDGRVLNVLGSPQHALRPPTTDPDLDAAAALRRVIADTDGRGSDAIAAGPDGPERTTRFRSGDRASLVIFGEGDSARLAWHVSYQQSAEAWWDAVVDAGSGRILRRVNLVKDLAASVYDRYPGAGSPVTVDFAALGWLDAAATTLSGPNAHAWANVDGNDSLDAGEDVAPADIPFEPQAGAGCASGPACSWIGGSARSWATDLNDQRSTIQAFYYVNRFHDWLRDQVAFTPTSGNFEGDDPVEVLALDGADTAVGLPADGYQNNASMATPFADGVSPVMRMYLFTGAGGSRDVSGADDAAIVYHEYTHGLTNRLIGWLDGRQGEAMGEGWSDFFAMDYLVEQRAETDTATPAELDLGAYTNGTDRIREQAIDCPVDAAAAACPEAGGAGSGGFTFGDFGKVIGHPEAHADGEIWAQTLWDLRQSLTPAIARQMIGAALRSTPFDPTFLEARDAIIAAAPSRADRVKAWDVFAERGMGLLARTRNGDDVTPREDFSVPNALPAGPLAVTPANVQTGRSVRLDASGVVDPDGLAVASYDWDFDGDGVRDAVGAGADVAHAYARAGTFAPRVWAHDSRGGEGTASASVTVTAPAPPRPARTVMSPPALTIASSGRRGRLVFTVTCRSRCSGSARVTISSRVAKRLKVSRTVGRATVRIRAAGKRRVTVRLSSKVVWALRRARVKSLRGSLVVRVVDSRGKAARKTRAVRIFR